MFCVTSPRRIRAFILASALLLLTSLPSFRVDQGGGAFAPGIAQAGGSPDETLKLHDSSLLRSPSISRTDLRLTGFQRWRIFVSLFRGFATRF